MGIRTGRAADNLPERFRTVFILRMIEGMSPRNCELARFTALDREDRLHLSFRGQGCAVLTDSVMRRLGLSC